MNSLYTKLDNLMDAKNNAILDNPALRMALVVAGFSAWLVSGIALLKFV